MAGKGKKGRRWRERVKRLLHSCDLPQLCCPSDDEGRSSSCPTCGKRWVAHVIYDTVAVTDGVMDCSTVDWRMAVEPTPHIGSNVTEDSDATT